MAEYYDEWIKNIDMTYRLRGGSTQKDRELLADERRASVQPAIAAAGDDRHAYRVSKAGQAARPRRALADVHGKHDAVTKLRREGKFDEATEALAAAEKAVADTLDHFYAAAD